MKLPLLTGSKTYGGPWGSRVNKAKNMDQNKLKKVPGNTITRDVKDLAAPTGNIYESVVIMYKRANQIAAAEKKELDKKLEDIADFFGRDIFLAFFGKVARRCFGHHRSEFANDRVLPGFIILKRILFNNANLVFQRNTLHFKICGSLRLVVLRIAISD